MRLRSGIYESGEELLAQLPTDARSSCILLDIKIPELSGPELQARLNDMGSHLPIIFLTGHGDISTTVQVIKAGAEDLLTKPVGKEELLTAIELAIARGRARQEEEDKRETMRRLVNRLTPRERQVFERVARGRLNKQIAYELGSTERTVKAHRRNLMEKLGIELRPSLCSSPSASACSLGLQARRGPAKLPTSNVAVGDWPQGQ